MGAVKHWRLELPARLAAVGIGFLFLNFYSRSGAPWNGPIICPFRLLTGHPCPFCGTTRAVASFSLGNFREAWSQNAFGLVFVGLSLIIFIQPNVGNRISEILEDIRNRTSKTSFVVIIITAMSVLWIWNLTRW